MTKRIGEVLAEALMDMENPVEMVGNSNIRAFSRQNDKHPDVGTMQYFVPDEWAKNLQNEPDAYFLMRIPRKLLDQLVLVDEDVDTVADAEVVVTEAAIGS
jgi:hypothetical protein